MGKYVEKVIPTVGGKTTKAIEKYYLNDPGMPTSDSKYVFTDEMLLAYKKCKEDICYFAENFFIIISKSKRQKITLREYQKRFLTVMMNNNRVLLLTARQIGKTTLMTIYALWLATFYNDRTIGILANKGATAKLILQRIMLAYRDMPGWIKRPVNYSNTTEVQFDNGSKIFTAASSADSIRGHSLSCLILDEFGFLAETKAKPFLTSVMPTITQDENAKVFIASTPNGTGNTFHQMVERAESGESNFIVEKVIWRDLPDRDEEWKKRTIETDCNGSVEQFEQEYECKFLGSSNSPFKAGVFERLQNDVREPVKTLLDGRLKIYTEPALNRVYSIGVDVSEGIGKDASVVNVFDLTDLQNIEQVAMFWDNTINTIDYLEVVRYIAKLYGEPILSIERNGCGVDICNRMYYDFSYPRMVNYGVNTTTSKNFRPGIICTQNTKAPAINNMKYWVVDKGRVMIRDKRFVEELKHFERNNHNNKWSAVNGYHDDIIMSVSWALFVLHRNLVETYYIVNGWNSLKEPIQIMNTFRYTLDLNYEFNTNKQENRKIDNLPPILFSNDPVNVFVPSFDDTDVQKMISEKKSIYNMNQRERMSLMFNEIYNTNSEEIYNAMIKMQGK